MELQIGALNKYFLGKSIVDLNNNNQMQESDLGEDDELDSNANLQVNEQSLGDTK
jgi:hypothetical protein